MALCGCLERGLPPDVPQEVLHFVVKGDVEQWFKEQYASSTLNVCKHQLLPMMRGAKPMRILLQEGAVPVAVHRPSVILAHWQEQVRRNIKRDIKLGVLEDTICGSTVFVLFHSYAI